MAEFIADDALELCSDRVCQAKQVCCSWPIFVVWAVCINHYRRSLGTAISLLADAEMHQQATTESKLLVLLARLQAGLGSA